MNSPRVRASRLAPAAAIGMIILGVFAIVEVNQIVGAILIVLGLVMYVVNHYFTRSLRRALNKESGQSSVLRVAIRAFALCWH